MNEETQTVEVVEDDKKVAAEPEQVTKDQKDEKKYTDAEVDDIINKKYAKWKEEQEKAESEAKKLAKMNAEDKQKYQLDKREQDLADREAEITRRELTAEAKSILSERGLPIELVDVVNLTDANSVNDSINAIQKSWNDAVAKGISDKTKGTEPIKKASSEKSVLEKWERDFLK